MDLSRRTAFHRRILLLYQNTRAVDLVLDDGTEQLDRKTRSWLEQAASEIETITRTSEAGLFPLSDDQHRSMLNINQRVREIYGRVAHTQYGDFDRHLGPNAASDWHKDYQFG